MQCFNTKLLFGLPWHTYDALGSGDQSSQLKIKKLTTFKAGFH